jgi:hypothetical protein
MFTNVKDRIKFELDLSQKNSDPDWLKSNITLQDLVRSVGCDTIRDFIDNSALKQRDSHYDTNIDGYVEVFKVLHDLDIKEPVNGNRAIVVLTFDNPDSSYVPIDVYIFDFDNPKESYATYLTPWAEVACCYALRENLDEFSINDFITNILYDITFFGFTEEQIQKKADEFKRISEEADEEMRLMAERSEIPTDNDNK